jgi:hypothetical protein
VSRAKHDGGVPCPNYSAALARSQSMSAVARRKQVRWLPVLLIQV